MYEWLVIIILIIYIYQIQYSAYPCEKMFIDEALPHFRTGDIILFKASNNFNSIVTTSYFGHMGMIYVCDGVPMLFEANGIEHMNLKPHHNGRGVFLSPVCDRIKKYKGRCYWKPLNKEIDPLIAFEFGKFIQYALKNMYYDTQVIQSGFKKLLGLERCCNGTNCGEIVFLALIKLNLLSIEEYDVQRLNHLKYTSNITELSNDYRYLPLIEIVDHPFAY